LAEVQASYDAALSELNTLKLTLESTSAKNVELEQKTNELLEKVTSLTKENEDFKAEKVKAFRVSLLTQGGISSEDASTKVELFSNLSDEQFTTLANELVVAYKLVEDAKANKIVETAKEDESKSKASENKDKLPDLEIESVLNPVADVATAGLQERYSKMLETLDKQKNKQTKKKTEIK
jgi:hypothetical protein